MVIKIVYQLFGHLVQFSESGFYIDRRDTHSPPVLLYHYKCCIFFQIKKCGRFWSENIDVTHYTPFSSFASFHSVVLVKEAMQRLERKVILQHEPFFPTCKGFDACITSSKVTPSTLGEVHHGVLHITPWIFWGCTDVLCGKTRNVKVCSNYLDHNLLQKGIEKRIAPRGEAECQTDRLYPFC